MSQVFARSEFLFLKVKHKFQHHCQNLACVDTLALQTAFLFCKLNTYNLHRQTHIDYETWKRIKTIVKVKILKQHPLKKAWVKSV